MNRHERRRARALPRELVKTTPRDWDPVQLAPAQPGVTLRRREGVFVHSFMCNLCGLHFNVYSWQQDRHDAGNVWCPECGQHRGLFRHFRAQLSESPELSLSHPGEIFRHCEYPRASFMDDSTDEGLRRVEGTYVD